MFSLKFEKNLIFFIAEAYDICCYSVISITLIIWGPVENKYNIFSGYVLLIIFYTSVVLSQLSYQAN